MKHPLHRNWTLWYCKQEVSSLFKKDESDLHLLQSRRTPNNMFEIFN